MVLPSPDHFTVAARFCPLLFELRESKSRPVITLPYRMIFAIATKCSVYLYDTQQKLPFGLISNIHYTRLTDLTWSNDGNTLLVSSTDGYCSIVQFSEGELGKVYKEQTIEDIILLRTAKVEPKKKKKSKKPSSAKKDDIKDKSPSVDEKENKDKIVEPIDEISLNLPESIKEIIPVDKIIKSNEIFSPEKQMGSPATPIQIRKFPRNLNGTESSPSRNDGMKQSDATTPTTSNFCKSITPTRIEIRRQPRVLHSNTAVSPKNVSMPSAFGSPKSKKKLL